VKAIAQPIAQPKPVMKTIAKPKAEKNNKFDMLFNDESDEEEEQAEQEQAEQKQAEQKQAEQKQADQKQAEQKQVQQKQAPKRWIDYDTDSDEDEEQQEQLQNGLPMPTLKRYEHSDKSDDSSTELGMM